MDYIRKIHFALLLVTLLTLHVRANTETINGYTWKYRINGDTAEIYDGGYECAISPAPTGKVCIPQFLGGKPVTKIGDSSFISCTELTDVEIPDSVTAIGVHSFEGCTNLYSILIPANVEAIGSYAFSNCTGLKSATISDGVKRIGTYAFSGCSALMEVTIPDSLAIVEFGTFQDCRSLTSITIPNSVTNIGYNVLSGCANLESITIPFVGRFRDGIGADAILGRIFGQRAYDGGESVRQYFKGSENSGSGGSFTFHFMPFTLHNVTVTDAPELGHGAFYGCGRLTQVTLPATLTNIEEYVFYGCSNLESIVVANENPYYKSESGLLLTKDGQTLVCVPPGLVDVVIPDGVVNIGDGAFESCTKLKSVQIPEGVMAIGRRAFYGCNSLMSITIPDTVVDIGKEAFRECKSLIDVWIRGSVANVGDYAFAWSDNLRSVTILGAVDNIGTGAFYGRNEDLKIYLPQGEDGTAEKFRSFTSQITFYKSAQTVVFDANGGSVSPIKTDVVFLEPYGVLPTPSRPDYFFLGWTYENRFIDETSIVSAIDDHTLVARWIEVQPFAFYFDANGGDGSTNIIENCGAALVPPTVGRAGYTFKCWVPEVHAIAPASNVTYTAQWQVNQYNISFDANGGTGGTSILHDYGSAIAPPSVTRTGYTFVGWSPAVVETVPDHDVTYVAQWKINQYTLTFDLGDGSPERVLTQDYGTEIIAPTVSRVGHAFLRWLPDIPSTMPANDMSFTAQWQPNSYSIFFDSNGGVLDYAELTRTYGDEYGELPVPTWEEHVFNGWELDGSPITAKTIVDVPSNHTLRATWSEIVMLPPLNDNFADADDFGAASGLSGDNSNATAEEGEPLTNRWENATTTVWWKWTAPEDGTATFDTVGSSFDTVMGVYVGESLGNLSVVAEDDDGAGAGNLSAVTFQATSGTTYHICVAGYRGATGDITINRNFSAVAKPQPPSPVVSLSATEDGPGVIRVSWGAPTETTATGYKVYRATRPNFDKAMLVTVLSDKWSLSYDDTDVSVDPTYYYWISAFNDVGESEVAGPVIGYCEEPLQIETSSLPVATELVEYETAILPEYDSGHLNWHVEYDEYGNPMLPDGLDMSSDGIISGCPTQAGTYTFTVSCCDTRFGVSVSKELTLTVAENPNRKPVVTAAEPANGTDVVISNGTSQLFKVTASDPDGKGITYRWVVDGEEVSSGTQNSYRLRTSEDEPGTSHEVVCYVNDDLWTDFVACRWTVYVPNELHVSTDDGEWALINAIWDSAPYDTIHVAPGTYSADIWIQHPLTIVATDGPIQTKLEGTIEFNTDERALGKIAVLRGFTLTEYGYHKGYSDLSLERCIVAESGGGWEHWYEDEYDEEEDSEDVQERGILLHCTLTRCTIAANVADPEVLPLMVGCEYGGDTVIWGNEGAENDASDPMFVDAANGDYRLRTISPHVIDGTATKGALDEVVDGFVISASVVGVGALDKMTAVVSPGGNATFAVATGSHPLDHFEVNGNSVSGIGNAYTFSNVLSDATLTAVFVSNVTFYVDAANGNDVNDGFTKASAVATLQEAVNRAVDGDTVRVADGTYEPVFTDAKHIVIESANGYKTTVIDGGGTNGCVNVGYNPSGSFPPTISTNTVIRGFTLTNGRAFHGGGIIGGIAERCLVRNCVAFNEGPGHSAAFVYGEGGGAYCSTLRYCTIVENTAEFWPGYEWECDPYTTGGEGGGTYACTLEHCIVWNNTAEVTPDDDGSLCYVTCFEDPGFVDILNGDMRIDATSPWVVAGRATVGCEPDVEITSKPAQPQWNDVTCGNATDGVHLSWTGAGDQASYWVIYRADEEEYGYERLAHVDEPTYVDTTAVQDVHYWYWVEGYNKKGRSEESELAEGWCVAPLSVPDLAMPTGTVGRGYSVEFVAAGGNGEGCWWEQIGRGYDVERVNDTGHSMEYRGEETAIGGEYVLPFDFPVCDTSIRSVTIGDGNLSGGMENGLGWIELYPYWSQNDDFTLWVEWDRCAVRSQPDGVCFTWWTHYSYETWLEVTLYADGRIRYRYSGAAVRGQVVPQLYMFHEDDIGNGYEFRPWPDCAEIVTSGTGYLFVPQSDGDLPPGISCDDDGFSGVPETNGVWAVRMRVHDWLHPDAVWSDAVFDIAIEKPQPYHPESEYYDDFVLWLEENGLLSSADSATEDDVYEAATKTEPGGKPFWHDFVTGANPLETNDVFHATISIENGEVEVSWSPQLPAAEAAKRVYTIYGSTELPSSGDAEWTPIPDGTDKSAYRFFKVGVEMR